MVLFGEKKVCFYFLSSFCALINKVVEKYCNYNLVSKKHFKRLF